MRGTCPLVPPQGTTRHPPQPEVPASWPGAAAPWPGEVSTPVAVPLPLVMITAALVYAALRYGGLKTWHAVACVILGFLLAATGLAPAARDLLTSLATWLTHLAASPPAPRR